MDISLGEAWRLWTGGELPKDALLWGKTILWWGRVGTLLQFVGGVTVIAEIIGAEKIRVFGQSIHARITLDSTRRFIGDAWQWYKALLKYASSSTDSNLQTIEGYRANDLNSFMALAATAYLGYHLWGQMNGWILMLMLLLAVIVFGYIICPIVTLSLIATGALLGILIDVLLVEPLAWLLEQPSLDRLVKISSLLLLAIGFHFDFLAS